MTGGRLVGDLDRAAIERQTKLAAECHVEARDVERGSGQDGARDGAGAMGRSEVEIE